MVIFVAASKFIIHCILLASHGKLVRVRKIGSYSGPSLIWTSVIRNTQLSGSWSNHCILINAHFLRTIIIYYIVLLGFTYPAVSHIRNDVGPVAFG